MQGNVVVLIVALLVWALLFLYLLRLERRVKELEKR
ncbi:MAG TPA: CcmD family protein [Candidatus Limnocylindria bacterium]|nr:CcmD family protein [Candidatus Limnocylindria bacterium]